MSGIIEDGEGASLSDPGRGIWRAAAAMLGLELLFVALSYVLPGLIDASRLGLSSFSLQIALQLTGLVLAAGGFALIVGVLLPRLRARAADRQTQLQGLESLLQNLETGLFVLDPASCFETRRSASLPGLLGRPVSDGDSFRLMLAGWLSEEQLELAGLYMRLLLGGRTKEKLMRDLNPLREVAITTPRGVRHLCFSMRRLREGDEALRLLVSVSDVSASVRQRTELDAARKQADEQWNLMLRLLQLQPASLLDFIEESSASLLEVHERFKSTSGRPAEYRVAVSHVFRVAHSIKSNATVLGLDFVAGEASAFEDLLDRLRGEDSYGADDLALVAAALQKLFEHMGWLRNVAKRYAEQPAAAQAPAQIDFKAGIVDLARRVAEDRSKSVNTRVRLDALAQLPSSAASAVRMIAAQFVRNAIAHGIESPTERSEAGKPAAGQVLVELESASDTQYVLRVRDDGRGLSAQHLRKLMLDAGKQSEAELAELSDQQVVMQIFKRGFTTADSVDAHAGRGVGLDVVNHAVKRLGGRVRLQSLAGQFTEFRVEFAA